MSYSIQLVASLIFSPMGFEFNLKFHLHLYRDVLKFIKIENEIAFRIDWDHILDISHIGLTSVYYTLCYCYIKIISFT